MGSFKFSARTSARGGAGQSLFTLCAGRVVGAGVVAGNGENENRGATVVTIGVAEAEKFAADGVAGDAQAVNTVREIRLLKPMSQRNRIGRDYSHIEGFSKDR